MPDAFPVPVLRGAAMEKLRRALPALPAGGAAEGRCKMKGAALASERALIGAIIVDPDRAWREVADLGLVATDFADATNRRAFAAILRLRSAGKPITETTLQDTGLALPELTKLVDAAESAAAARYHATAIRGAALQRRAHDEIRTHGGTPEGLRLALRQIEESLPDVDSGGGFPRIQTAGAFTSEPLQRPPEVIKGALFQGGKLVYGGPSKAFKSWTLLDMCIGVSMGANWLGFETAQGRSLYVNLELIEYSVQQRIKAITSSRAASVPDALHVWNLRGRARPLPELLGELKSQIKGEGFSLIVIDPIYKCLQGRAENDTGDIGTMLGEIEAVALETGAAVAFGAHFAKGNAAGKVSMDRISGSGVFARDPDAILTATPHREEGCFTVDCTLRDFAQVAPFGVRWTYPRMTRDATLDPLELLQPKTGRPSAYSVHDVLRHIGTDPQSLKDWQRRCQEDGGISRMTFFRLKREALQRGVVTQTESGLWHTPIK